MQGTNESWVREQTKVTEAKHASGRRGVALGKCYTRMRTYAREVATNRKATPITTVAQTSNVTTAVTVTNATMLSYARSVDVTSRSRTKGAESNQPQHGLAALLSTAFSRGRDGNGFNEKKHLQVRFLEPSKVTYARRASKPRKVVQSRRHTRNITNQGRQQ